MADVTQLLDAAVAGNPKAASYLLPLIYDELRKLAVAQMAEERADHTLPPTALVHEAYLRLVGSAQPQGWTFVVNLSTPTNATIADGQSVGTVVDDENRRSGPKLDPSGVHRAHRCHCETE